MEVSNASAVANSGFSICVLPDCAMQSTVRAQVRASQVTTDWLAFRQILGRAQSLPGSRRKSPALAFRRNLDPRNLALGQKHIVYNSFYLTRDSDYPDIVLYRTYCVLSPCISAM
jgi:hypothetical protein